MIILQSYAEAFLKIDHCTTPETPLFVQKAADVASIAARANYAFGVATASMAPIHQDYEAEWINQLFGLTLKPKLEVDSYIRGQIQNNRRNEAKARAELANLERQLQEEIVKSGQEFQVSKAKKQKLLEDIAFFEGRATDWEKTSHYFVREFL